MLKNMKNGGKLGIGFGLFLFSVLVLNTPLYAIDLNDAKVEGDFGYSYEHFDKEDIDTIVTFNGQQLGMRLRFSLMVTKDVSTIIQFSSGESNAPFSTDQTITGSFSSKHAWVDQAYVRWQFGEDGNYCITGGKSPNPFYRPANNQLIWNPDVFVEGISFKYKKTSSSLGLFGVLGSYTIEQRSTADDSWLNAAQAGVSYSVSGINLLGGATWYGYTNTVGYAPFWAPQNSFGNSVDAQGNYLNEYDILELFGVLAFKDLRIPLSLYGDYVTNSGADEDNMAYLAGVSLGKLAEPLDWMFTYHYIQIEQDALIGVFNDPDFADGVTDSKGSKLNAAVCIAKNVVADVTYINSTMGIDNGKYYRWLQLALCFNF